MIIREKYLKQIRPFYDSDLIKIITGIRRCGKSIVLSQIRDELASKTDNIIYLNFEDKEIETAFSTWKELLDYVEENRKEGLCYVFLDEIQALEEWAEAVKTLRLRNCSVFITGSNSRLLSSEFTDHLSGRYVSFRIYPFVFKELAEYGKQLNKEITVTDYLSWGGFPKRIEFDGEEAQRRYLNDLEETIVFRDLILRKRINKPDEFRKLTNYILCINSRTFSVKGITDYMTKNGSRITDKTVKKWMAYLEEAYVISHLSLYSTKAKRELDYYYKVYDADVAFNSLRVFNNRYDFSHNLENIVYNELIYRDYHVSVFINQGKEIDFVAEKDGRKYYIQVAMSVVEDKAYNREMDAFKGLSQLDRKILITTDPTDYSTSNVTHVSFERFLSLETLAEI